MWFRAMSLTVRTGSQQVAGWLVSPRDRAVLMAEGQSGKGEGRELDGSILT